MKKYDGKRYNHLICNAQLIAPYQTNNSFVQFVTVSMEPTTV